MFKYFIMDRFDELNDRLMNRDKFNMDGNIKFDIRSTPTRNTFPFPIVEKKIECKTKFSNVTKDYNKEIEIETNLMNRSYPLQHGASQSVYVPSSTSDLYNVTMSIPSTGVTSFSSCTGFHVPPDIFLNNAFPFWPANSLLKLYSRPAP